MAIEGAFGIDADYARLIKIYGPPEGAVGRYSPGDCSAPRGRRVVGKSDPDHISTSYVERQNLTMRESMPGTEATMHTHSETDDFVR